MTRKFCLPNQLSIFRGALGIALPWILWPREGEIGIPLQRGLWAIVVFLIASITDYFDGWIARRHHLESSLGRILDPAADKILVLGALTSFSAWGLFSHWWLLPFYLREAGVTFCRVSWLLEGQAIGAEKAGKIKFLTQEALIFCSLLTLFFQSRPLFVLNYIFLVNCLILTLYSGFLFFSVNRVLLQKPSFLMKAAALGVGFFKPSPGTYGSLIGLITVMAIGRDPYFHAAVLAISVYLAYEIIGRLNLKPEQDPQEVVVDEFCGILVTFIGIPLNPATLLGGFILFRFFDISKIFPISWFEKRKGAHGIMGDDLMAGFLSWIILKALT